MTALAKTHLHDPNIPSVFKATRKLIAVSSTIPPSVVAILARVGIAGVFWRSGQTKVEGWNVTELTVDLFRDEYALPLIPPEIAAYSATFAEHFFPVLLIVGLATRLSAAALLIMTLVIQLFVYPGSWPDHAVWATGLVFLMAAGPGRISLDHIVARLTRGHHMDQDLHQGARK